MSILKALSLFWCLLCEDRAGRHGLKKRRQTERRRTPSCSGMAEISGMLWNRKLGRLMTGVSCFRVCGLAENCTQANVWRRLKAGK